MTLTPLCEFLKQIEYVLAWKRIKVSMTKSSDLIRYRINHCHIYTSFLSSTFLQCPILFLFCNCMILFKWLFVYVWGLCIFSFLYFHHQGYLSVEQYSWSKEEEEFLLVTDPVVVLLVGRMIWKTLCISKFT